MAISNTIEQITIDLPLEIKTALEQKAKGQDIKTFIQSIVKKQALRPNLDEVLTSVRQEFDKSGMSEDDLDVFMNSIREKNYQEKLKNKQI
jgi:hypothetical protein